MGRIAGDGNSDSFNSNIANSAMTGGSFSSNANGADGADKDSAAIANQSTYTDMGWDFSAVWKMESGYPVLR
jgi:hypothetical protein